MKRKLAIVAVCVTALVGAVALACPIIARYVAEAEVDDALRLIRRQSTAVANRGDVSVDIAKRSVTIRDLSIEPPGDGSKVRIAALTFRRPWKSNERLSADEVVLEGVTVTSPLAITTAPRIAIRSYSGPARGLVATPGIGAIARSQADVIGQVSSAGADIPSIEIADQKTGVRRTLDRVSIGRVDGGLVSRVTVSRATIDAPDLRPAPKQARELELTAGELVAERLSLPILWRFFAGDGAGDREPLAEMVSASRASVTFGLRPSGSMTIRSDLLYAKALQLRALAFPFTVIDDVVAKLRRGEAPTPADVRRQASIVVDAASAFSFGAIGAKETQAQALLPDGRRVSAALKSFEIGPYVDARLANITAQGLTYDDGAGVSAAIERFDLVKLDATRLAAYGARVGRDEIMLTTRPTAEDVILTAPRIERIALTRAGFRSSLGELNVAGASVDIDAPLDAVPQRLAMKFDALDVAPSSGSWFAEALRSAAVERLRGAATLTLALNPTNNKLELDALEARLEGIGAITAKGSLAKVDPTIAISKGADFVDKLSAIVIQSFKFTARNDGGFETLLRRAAEQSGAEAEQFREATAVQADAQLLRLFGPPAAQSGEALADFIREPRSIVVSIDPKSPDVTLIDFIRSLALGPAGIAQTIDVTVLNKR
ncbi:hypothetical protein [Hansschlegelia plantiphila]|uniref:Uncharacterized protein n=1 Tax=Hansschlegelia plantiphila TaxID=374655 RepID=A0A9W6MV01_9HYPH|nr:hypothetical protein [Hansschlegelia plantiphila]GLK67423.1 hypothetical protein GCM10008179_10610 [Hansschlegelia plantiphila]